MKRQAYQHPELRDANDNIIQEGTYGKESPLVNSDNTGVLDYINNNLEALYDNINGSRIYVANKDALPATGDLSAMYIAEDTGKWYLWNGTKYIETDNARRIADEAIAARDAAKASANDAANSAREQQADWNVTDTTSKAYIKNKPEVLTYQTPKRKEPSKWEDNTIQSIAQAFPDDHPTAYAYGVKVTLGRIKNEEGHTNLYFPHNGGMCLKSYWGSDSNTSGWLTMLTDQNYSNFALPKNGTAVKATADAAGNNIQTTYAKKADLSSSVSTTSLTVTGATSVPTANAGNSSKAIANTEFVAKSISALVNGAPDQLNTLNELAKALGNDSNFAATITAELAKKLNSTEAEREYATKQEAANISTGLTQAETRISTAETRISTAETRISTAVPTGCVQAFAGSTTPQGWLLCDGSAVSRTDYAALYAVIGTTYGAGNGSTTFNLPNLTDRFIEGNATAGTVKSAGLPNITGSIGGGSGSGGTAGNGSGIGFLRDSMINGCFQPSAKAYGNETGTGGRTVPSGYPVMTANLDASRSSAIYGKSTTVQPPALTMRYIIKY